MFVDLHASDVQSLKVSNFFSIVNARLEGVDLFFSNFKLFFTNFFETISFKILHSTLN
jgi:hypothetical protein